MLVKPREKTEGKGSCRGKDHETGNRKGDVRKDTETKQTEDRRGEALHSGAACIGSSLPLGRTKQTRISACAEVASSDGAVPDPGLAYVS